MPQNHISTDYLIIGAGFSSLAFADELLMNTQASITIVDRRDCPGGHWVDSYPFVKLHQPSSFYGVSSTQLTDHRIDQFGPNKGLGSLATGPEIRAYCQNLLTKRFLPSGRVTYVPCTEYQSDGSLLNLLNGKVTTVEIKKKLIDASWYTNSIPLTHNRSFLVDPSITCIPPNDLPRAALKFQRFTVLGAGKTAVDTCTWLLTNGAEADQIRWVIPNDYWYFNRLAVQDGPEFFNDVLRIVTESRYSIAEANNADELAAGFEKTGFWLRLDPEVFPKHFHAAVISTAELELIRSIKDVVRMGRVTEINNNNLVLTKGSLAVSPDTLYIDCTASAISHKPSVPVFQPGKIVVQIVRFPLITLSAAAIGFLESQDMSDDEKNSLCTPIPFCNTTEEYVISLACDYKNRLRTMAHPVLSKWTRQTRLDGFSRILSDITPDQKEKLAVLQNLQRANEAASANLARLVARVQEQNSETTVKASL